MASLSPARLGIRPTSATLQGRHLTYRARSLRGLPDGEEGPASQSVTNPHPLSGTEFIHSNSPGSFAIAHHCLTKEWLSPDFQRNVPDMLTLMAAPAAGPIIAGHAPLVNNSHWPWPSPRLTPFTSLSHSDLLQSALLSLLPLLSLYFMK